MSEKPDLVQVIRMRWDCISVKVVVEFLDSKPEQWQLESCESVLLDRNKLELKPGLCFTLSYPTLLYKLKCRLKRNERNVYTFKVSEGAAIRFGGVYFVAKNGCKASVKTSLGTVSVENLCPVDDAMFKELTKEVAIVFGIPLTKVLNMDKMVLALYYSAKMGIMEFENIPKKPKIPDDIAELLLKLIDTANRVPPDVELVVVGSDL